VPRVFLLLLTLVMPAALAAGGEVVFTDDLGTAGHWWPMETPVVRIASFDPPEFRFQDNSKLQAIGVIRDSESPGDYGVGFRWDYSRPAASAVRAVQPGFPSAERAVDTWPWPDRDVLELGRAAEPALMQAVREHYLGARDAHQQATAAALEAWLAEVGPGEFHGLNDYGRALLMLLLDEPELPDGAGILADAHDALRAGLQEALAELAPGWPYDLGDPARWPPALRRLIGDYGVAAVPVLQGIACVEPAVAPKVAWMLEEIRRRTAQRLVADALSHGHDHAPTPDAIVAAASAARDVLNRIEQERNRLVLLPWSDEVAARLAGLEILQNAVQTHNKPADPDRPLGPADLGRLLAQRDRDAAHAAKRAWLRAVVLHRDRQPEHGYEPELGVNVDNAGRKFDEQRGYGFRAAGLELRAPGVQTQALIRVSPGSAYELTYRVRIRNAEYPADHPDARRLLWQSAWVEIVPLDTRGRPLAGSRPARLEPGVEPGRSAPFHFAADGPRNAGPRHTFTPGGWQDGRILLPQVPDGVDGILIRIVLSDLRGAGEVLFDGFRLTRLATALDETFEHGLRMWRTVTDLAPFARATVERGDDSVAVIRPGNGTAALERTRRLPLRPDRSYVLEARLKVDGGDIRVELLTEGTAPLRLKPPPPGEDGWAKLHVRLDNLLPQPPPREAVLRIVVRGESPASEGRVAHIRLREEPLLRISPGDLLPAGAKAAVAIAGLPAAASRIEWQVEDGSGHKVSHGSEPASEGLAAPLRLPGTGAYSVAVQVLDDTGQPLLTRTLRCVVLETGSVSGIVMDQPRLADRTAAVRPQWLLLPGGAELPLQGRFIAVAQGGTDYPAALELLDGPDNRVLADIRRLAGEGQDRVVGYHLGPLHGAGFGMRGADPAAALDAAREALQASGASWAEVLIPFELDGDLERFARAFAKRRHEALSDAQQAADPRGDILLKPQETLNLVVPAHWTGRQMQEAVRAILPRIGRYDAPFEDNPCAGRVIVTLTPASMAEFVDRRVRLIGMGINRVLTSTTADLLLDEHGAPREALAAWAHLAGSLEGARPLEYAPLSQTEVPHLVLRDRRGQPLMVVLPGSDDREFTLPVGHDARAYDVFGARLSGDADAHGNLTVRSRDGMPVFVRRMNEEWLRTLASMRFEPELDARMEDQPLALAFTSGFRMPGEFTATLLHSDDTPARVGIRGASFAPGENLPPLGTTTAAPGEPAALAFSLRPMPGFASVPTPRPVTVEANVGGLEFRARRMLAMPVRADWAVSDARFERVEGQLELVITLSNQGTDPARANVDVMLRGVEGSWRRGRAFAPSGSQTEVRFAWLHAAADTKGLRLDVMVTETPGLRFATGSYELAVDPQGEPRLR
jgi:hypothetical protein